MDNNFESCSPLKKSTLSIKERAGEQECFRHQRTKWSPYMARQRSLGICKNQVQAMQKRVIKPGEKIFLHVIDKKIKTLYIYTNKQILSKKQTIQPAAWSPRERKKSKEQQDKNIPGSDSIFLNKPLRCHRFQNVSKDLIHNINSQIITYKRILGGT